MKLPELLSPAGGMEQLKAAVENGADAVYMGGRRFSARSHAANFGPDELKQALDYTHIRGVSMYLAMNTLIADSEMQQALDEAGQARLMGVDALIVQDLGFAALVRRQLPDFPLHLSTQGTIYSAEGIEALEPLGFQRVILARELPLDAVAAIARRSKVPVEVFAHGALCICYSGQCLMSSLIGGRSGNRGSCAQPCRLPYRLASAQGYLLSPKDLCTLDILPELVHSGVAALKIEGRMKSPEYVAVVTDVYRRHLDRCAEAGEYRVEEGDRRNLLQVFNRGGFTRGYLKGEIGRALISREKPKHWGVPLGRAVRQNRQARLVEVQLTAAVSLGDGVEFSGGAGGIVTNLSANGVKAPTAGPGRATIGYIDGAVQPGEELVKISDKALNDRARASFEGKPRRKVPVEGVFTAAVGEPMRLELWDAEHRLASAVSADPAGPAESRPLTADVVRAQLARTGDTPFELAHCRLELDGRVAARLSDLNGLRREALEELQRLRAHRYPDRAPVPLQAGRPCGPAEPVEPGISLFFYRWKQEYEHLLPLADRAYLPFAAFQRGVRAEDRPRELYAWLPAVTAGTPDELLKQQSGRLAQLGIGGMLVGNPEHLAILRESGVPLVGDASFHVFNGWTLEIAARLGLAGVTLSQELTMEQIEALPDCGIPREAVVYGRHPLMISAHCPIGSELGGKSGSQPCGMCTRGGGYELVDRIGARFPMLCDPQGCRSMILNSSILAVPGLAPRLARAGVSLLRLAIFDETPEEVGRIIAQFRGALRGERAEGLKGPAFTKGHYFRGVLE